MKVSQWELGVISSIIDGVVTLNPKLRSYPSLELVKENERVILIRITGSEFYLDWHKDLSEFFRVKSRLDDNENAYQFTVIVSEGYNYWILLDFIYDLLTSMGLKIDRGEPKTTEQVLSRYLDKVMSTGSENPTLPIVVEDILDINEKLELASQADKDSGFVPPSDYVSPVYDFGQD